MTTTPVARALREHRDREPIRSLLLKAIDGGDAAHAECALMAFLGDSAPDVKERLFEALEEQAVIEFARSHLAAYKVPARVFFTEQAFPRTATNKVLKAELKASVVPV